MNWLRRLLRGPELIEVRRADGSLIARVPVELVEIHEALHAVSTGSDAGFSEMTAELS